MQLRLTYRNAMTASLLAVALSLGGCVVGASTYYPGPEPYVNDYWYYPSVGVYYDNQRGYYHYNSGGTWVETTVLPSYLYSGLGTYVVLDNPGPRPWRYYDNHRRYYPPDRYRHYPPQPPPPRYGSRPRWDDDRPDGRPPSGDWRPPSGNNRPPGGYVRPPGGYNRPPDGDPLGPFTPPSANRPPPGHVRPPARPPGGDPPWPVYRPPGGDRPSPGQGPRPFPRPEPKPVSPPRGDYPVTRPGGPQVRPSLPPSNRPDGQRPPIRTQEPPVIFGDSPPAPAPGVRGNQGPSPGYNSRPNMGAMGEY